MSQLKKNPLNNIPRKTVFHFLNTGNYSGAENVVINIALLTGDFDHVYVSPSGRINQILKSYGIKHIIVDKLTLHSVFSVIQQNHPDIVHAHDFRASILIAHYSRYIHSYSGILISHLHNNDPRMKKIGLLSILYRFSIPKFDNIILVSESIISEFVFQNYVIKHTKFIILKNIVNTAIIRKKARMLRAPSSDLVFVGRLVEQKNPMMFLRVVKSIVKVFPDVKAIIIGDGPLKSNLKKYIRDYKLCENVQLLGFVENPYPFISSSKIGISTSSWEGFGLSILEQQLLGNTVLATPVGGVVNLVNNEVGLLSSSEEDMCIELKKLLSNNNYLEKKSKMAKKNAQINNNILLFQSELKKAYGCPS